MMENFTVLYVEDSRLLRVMVSNLLEDKVKEIHLANDGKEGLEQFSKIDPDIVISDINMPNMDGLEMSGRIKEISPDTPVILLTALDSISNFKKAIETGINFFISKPIQNDELIEAVSKAAKNLQNKKDSEKLKDMEQQKEKIDLLLFMLKEIGHHWRQPLSIAMTISSSYELKRRTGLYDSIEEEIKDINFISKQIEKLSSILAKVEYVDFENISIEEIKEIIQVSNPIYNKNEKE